MNRFKELCVVCHEQILVVYPDHPDRHSGCLGMPAKPFEVNEGRESAGTRGGKEGQEQPKTQSDFCRYCKKRIVLRYAEHPDIHSRCIRLEKEGPYKGEEEEKEKELAGTSAEGGGGLDYYTLLALMGAVSSLNQQQMKQEQYYNQQQQLLQQKYQQEQRQRQYEYNTTNSNSNNFNSYNYNTNYNTTNSTNNFNSYFNSNNFNSNFNSNNFNSYNSNYNYNQRQYTHQSNFNQTYQQTLDSSYQLPPTTPIPPPAAAAGESPQEWEVRRILECRRDYYMILGIQRTCGIDDIKKAYRKYALLVHPDKNSSTGSEEAFKLLSTAFSCLSDPYSRNQYDSGQQDFINEEVQRKADELSKASVVEIYNLFNNLFRDINRSLWG